MKTLIRILIILTGFAIEAKCQTSMTVGQIYDFNIGDEFHYYRTGSNGIPPNATRFIIIGKHFSTLNDTVFYKKHYYNYYTQVNWNPAPHLEYFFNSYNDSTFYTNLSIPFDSAYINWPSVDTGNWFNDTLFYSSQWCGRLIYDYTACQNCIFEGHYYHNQYGLGLGLVEAIHQCPAWPQIDDQYYLKYYRKGIIECGIPDTIDSASFASVYQLENYLNNISVYPNPATEKMTIDCSDMQNLSLFIYNIFGELLLQRELTKNKNEFDISAFSNGVYVIKVSNGDKIVTKKLLIE